MPWMRRWRHAWWCCGRLPCRLPLRTRTAVVLRYYEDLSVADTAAVMGIAEGTVKSSVAKGLDRLRLLLEDVDR